MELWEDCSRLEGCFIPYNTFRDWISKACLLRLKDEYTQSDYDWLMLWIEFKRKYPKRSSRKVKDFHAFMYQLMENSTNATHS